MSTKKIKADEVVTPAVAAFIGEEPTNLDDVEIVHSTQDTILPEESEIKETEQPKVEEVIHKEEPKVSTPIIDAKELINQAKQEITAELIEKLSPKEQAKAEQLLASWEKEGRNPTDYGDIFRESVAEAVKIAKEETIKEIDLRNKRQIEEQQKQKEVNDSAQRAYEKDLNERWDREFAELTRAGRIPAVTNPNDPNDPGKQAQSEILQAAVDAVKAGEMDARYPSMKIAYYEKYQDKKKPVAGRDAPVGTGKRTSNPTNERAQIDYETIHKTSLWDLVRGKG